MQTMLLLNNDENNHVTFRYTLQNQDVQELSREQLDKAVLDELFYSMDQFIAQSVGPLLSCSEADAWKILRKNAEDKYGASDKKDVSEGTINNYKKFVQCADIVMPMIIDEIRMKYGEERLESIMTKGDIMSSVQSNINELAWLYTLAKSREETDAMFAYAKQIYATIKAQDYLNHFFEEIERRAQN